MLYADLSLFTSRSRWYRAHMTHDVIAMLLGAEFDCLNSARAANWLFLI